MIDPYTPLVDVAALIRDKEITSAELTESMLDRISDLEPQLHSYALVTADLAMEQARSADESLADGRLLGSLHGVPLAVKDNCWTTGVVTTNGLAANDDFIPDDDSTVVRRLADSGSVLLGKLQQTEGAFAGHRPDITVPVNPWHPDAWTGESSSGAGVATAAGLCFGSIGTDTGGSIRFPSAACGLVGLKPTWGRVSRYGVFQNSASMDHVGPMARSVADVAAMLTVIAGADPKDPTASNSPAPDYIRLLTDFDLRGIKIGVDENYNSKGQDSLTLRVVGDAIEVLRELGAEIVPVELTGVDTAVDDWLPTSGVEMAAAHQHVDAAVQATYAEPLTGLIALGKSQSALDYFNRHLRRLEFRGVVDTILADVDLLLTPVQTGAATTLADMEVLGKEEGSLEALVRYTAPFDMTGHPALVIPGGISPTGVPTGFQMVGRRFDEGTILGAGHAFQAQTTWHRQHPAI